MDPRDDDLVLGAYIYYYYYISIGIGAARTISLAYSPFYIFERCLGCVFSLFARRERLFFPLFVISVHTL